MHDIPFYKPHGNEIELFEHAWRNQLPLLIKGPTGCARRARKVRSRCRAAYKRECLA
jgi:hypothetical protein